jgi:hypothetical protein
MRLDGGIERIVLPTAAGKFIEFLGRRQNFRLAFRFAHEGFQAQDAQSGRALSGGLLEHRCAPELNSELPLLARWEPALAHPSSFFGTFRNSWIDNISSTQLTGLCSAAPIITQQRIVRGDHGGSDVVSTGAAGWFTTTRGGWQFGQFSYALRLHGRCPILRSLWPKQNPGERKRCASGKKDLDKQRGLHWRRSRKTTTGGIGVRVPQLTPVNGKDCTQPGLQ